MTASAQGVRYSILELMAAQGSEEGNAEGGAGGNGFGGDGGKADGGQGAKAASRELLTAGLVVQEGLAAQTQAREDKAG